MSRVAKNRIVLPQGVEVKISLDQILIKGPLGVMQFTPNSAVAVTCLDGALSCSAVLGVPNSNALSGTVRAVLANMVLGVSKGFEKKLLLVGVGYRAQTQGASLNLTLGFSHPVVYQIPEGIKIETPIQTEILIKGVDKQKVGQVAADIRAYRKPEPYKGKGVRYSDESIVLKETKKK
ncbi:MAG: 50S ribosomal protein L6 [Pseudomonadota bacterium]